MRKNIPFAVLIILSLSFFGCYTTLVPSSDTVYYDGYHSDYTEAEKDTIAEADQYYGGYSEVFDDTAPIYNYYYYDPYEMNRYRMRPMSYAWYWRSMYRPNFYNPYRNRFSFYFGWNNLSIYNTWYSDPYNYGYYDPWDDYFYNDYSYYGGGYYGNYYYNRYGYNNYYHGNDRDYFVDDGTKRNYGRRRVVSGNTKIHNPNPTPVTSMPIRTIRTFTPTNDPGIVEIKSDPKKRPRQMIQKTSRDAAEENNTKAKDNPRKKSTRENAKRATENKSKSKPQVKNRQKTTRVKESRPKAKQPSTYKKSAKQKPSSSSKAPVKQKSSSKKKKKNS